MGTVGLSFGSPSSGQGIDVASTVTQMVTQLQNAETPYKTQLSALQAQDTVISNLGSLLSALSTDVQALTSATGVLESKQGSSSDTNALQLLSATSQAVAGSHTINVTQLAQDSTEVSGPFAASDEFTGSFSLHIGSGASQSFTVDPSDPTLAGLADSINQADLGVNASIVTDSSGSRLSLTSQTSGASGQITIDSNALSDSTTGAAVALSSGQLGQDAILTVDGIQTTTASNTVTGAIAGVTMQLLGASNKAVQVEITNNTQSVSSAVSVLVKDYNAVINALSAQEGKDTSGNAEPLYGSPILSSLQQTLSGVLTASSAGSGLSLGQVGISLNGDGTIALNGDQLTSALNDSYAEVQSFFQDSGAFGSRLSKAVNNLGASSSTGVLAQAQKANSNTEASLNATISTKDDHIATEKASLTTELNQANQTLQSIPLQLNMINEIYSAITGYNQKG